MPNPSKTQDNHTGRRHTDRRSAGSGNAKNPMRRVRNTGHEAANKIVGISLLKVWALKLLEFSKSRQKRYAFQLVFKDLVVSFAFKKGVKDVHIKAVLGMIDLIEALDNPKHMKPMTLQRLQKG